MKKVTIDFTNQIICIRARSYQETRKLESLEKEELAQFFPEKKYMTDYNSYTWNFDTNTFIVNQDKKVKGGESGEIRFLPEVIIPMPKLSRKYREFMDLLLSAS